MVEATRAGQEALDVRALETAFDEGSEPSAEFVVGYALAVTSTHMARWLPEAIGVTLAAGGNAEARTARETNVFRTAQGFEDLYFDQTNREAVLWAGERSSTLITQITAKTRTAIRATIARSFAEGIPTDQAARMIRSLVGLTPRQAGAAMTLRSKILAKPGKKLWAGRTPIRVPKAGATVEWLERRVGQYSSRLLNLRARTIARTETIAASNEGQRQLWGQAQKQGLLRSDQMKEWIVTPDDRLCDICEPLNGSVALINEPFPDIGVQGPPAHPACRCAMGIARKPWSPAKGSGLADPAKVEDTLAAYTRADGSIAPARKVLHDRIVANSLKGIPTHEKPIAYMTGGGPASGKSTMLKSKSMKHIPGKTRAVHVNPDNVKAQLPEYNAMQAAGDRRAAVFAHEESSMLAKRITREASKNGQHIVIDGTGDNSYAKLQGKVQALRSAGYRVEAYYASNDVELAQKLAHARGVRTGRFVPRSYVRQVHASVSRVVREATTGGGLFDSLVLYDTNVKGNARIVAQMLQGRPLTVAQQDLWADFLAKGGL